MKRRVLARAPAPVSAGSLECLDAPIDEQLIQSHLLSLTSASSQSNLTTLTVDTNIHCQNGGRSMPHGHLDYSSPLLTGEHRRALPAAFSSTPPTNPSPNPILIWPSGIFRKNAIFLTTVFAGAFAFEMSVLVRTRAAG